MGGDRAWNLYNRLAPNKSMFQLTSELYYIKIAILN